MSSRGLTDPEFANKLDRFCLGYVNDPLPGHEMYQGNLAIPYMRWSPWSGWRVVTMRFRCIEPDCRHDSHGKYMSEPGAEPRVFNTIVLHQNSDRVAICEGEIDAITATVSGFPAVGIGGSEAWQDFYTEMFVGYEQVVVLADGDTAGMKFAKRVAKQLPNPRIMPMPDSHDVNSFVVSNGKEALLEKVRK